MSYGYTPSPQAPGSAYPAPVTYPGPGGVPPQPSWPGYSQPLPPFVTERTAPKDVGFVEALRRFFGKYAQFSGAASLSEFWFAYVWRIIFAVVPAVVIVLGTVVLYSGAQTVSGAESSGTTTSLGSPVLLAVGFILLVLVEVVVLLPNIAVTVRRLHDSGRPGTWYWLVLVPFGQTALIILAALPRRIELWRAEWFR